MSSSSSSVSRFKWRISDCQRGLTVLPRNLDIFLCKQEDSVCLQSEDLDLVLTSYLGTFSGCRSCQGLNLSSICRTLFLTQSPQQSMRWWYRKKGKSVRLSCLFIFVDSLFHVLFCLFLFEQTAPSPSLKMKKKKNMFRGSPTSVSVRYIQIISLRFLPIVEKGLREYKDKMEMRYPLLTWWPLLCLAGDSVDGLSGGLYQATSQTQYDRDLPNVLNHLYARFENYDFLRKLGNLDSHLSSMII